MTKKSKISVNDLVKVVCADGSLGDTSFIVDWIGERGYCCIREAGNPLAGAKEFDISMLKKIDRK